MQFLEQEMIEITAAVSDLALQLELPRRADRPETNEPGCFINGYLQQFIAEARRP